MTAQLKTGSGTITRIDPTLPFLEYEFSWNDKTTGERKSAKCQFMLFGNDAKESIKTTPLKVGDIVQCEYEQNGWDKTLLKFGPKQVSSGGGWKKPFDPVAAAKKQEFEDRKQVLIVRRSCLYRSVSLWVNGNPGKVPTDADDEMILSRMEKYAERVMRQ